MMTERAYKVGDFSCTICGVKFENERMALYQDGGGLAPVCPGCERSITEKVETADAAGKSLDRTSEITSSI